MIRRHQVARMFEPRSASRLVFVVVAVAFIMGCGATTSSNGLEGSTGGAAGSTGGASGSGGGAAGGSGGAGGSDSSGGRASGGASGAAGSGGSQDSGIPNVCPGAAPPSGGYATCRTQADCPNQFDECAPDPATGCGVMPPPPGCYADSNCTGGQVCLLVPRYGCLDIGNHCVPPCTSTTCATDEICAASGHCDPKPCTSGFGCATETVCGPTKANADAHGCAPASCSSDGYACPAGFRCAASASADVHGCTDVSCTAGFVCPPNFDCDPASTALHHCEPRACSTDADCDCGACIGNICQPRLNVCSEEPS